LKNFSENAGDEGTVWFSDSGAEEKVTTYLRDLVDEGKLALGDQEIGGVDDEAAAFLDLGTGNGHFLFALREEGFAGYMLGVDYSWPSIALATRIETKRRRKRHYSDGVDDLGSLAPVDFQKLDILSPDDAVIRQFDVVLDKGTFDAISLSSETDSDGRRASEQYRSRIKPFLKPNGLFIITSCNWTEPELRKWFEVDDGEGDMLVYEDRLTYPTFRFQGQEGQTVVTLIFKLKQRSAG
jgi:EEF1A lysine methyltransferase 2